MYVCACMGVCLTIAIKEKEAMGVRGNKGWREKRKEGKYATVF